MTTSIWCRTQTLCQGAALRKRRGRTNDPSGTLPGTQHVAGSRHTHRAGGQPGAPSNPRGTTCPFPRRTSAPPWCKPSMHAAAPDPEGDLHSIYFLPHSSQHQLSNPTAHTSPPSTVFPGATRQRCRPRPTSGSLGTSGLWGPVPSAGHAVPPRWLRSLTSSEPFPSDGPVQPETTAG